MTTPQNPTLPPNYALINGPPPVPIYLSLRLSAGLSPKRPDQAALALPNSWYTCHITYTAPASPSNTPTDTTDTTPTIVGMARIIGDGGWYFHIADMAVHPSHQRKGLGDAIFRRLLQEIRDRAPAGAYVTLMADPPGRKLYRKFGMVESAPGSLGMHMVMGKEGEGEGKAL